MVHMLLQRHPETIAKLGGFKGNKATPLLLTMTMTTCCQGIHEPQCFLLAWASSWPDWSSPASQAVAAVAGPDALWASHRLGPLQCRVGLCPLLNDASAASWGVFLTSTNDSFHGNHPYCESYSQNCNCNTILLPQSQRAAPKKQSCSQAHRKRNLDLQRQIQLFTKSACSEVLACELFLPEARMITLADWCPLNIA